LPTINAADSSGGQKTCEVGQRRTGAEHDFPHTTNIRGRLCAANAALSSRKSSSSADGALFHRLFVTFNLVFPLAKQRQ
jgi:hypothetical protein